MTITGTIDAIFNPETRGTYTSRKLWLNTETDTKYPQKLEIECGGAKSNLFDKLQIGQSVTFEINLRGREWKDKVFNSIQAWDIKN